MKKHKQKKIKYTEGIRNSIIDKRQGIESKQHFELYMLMSAKDNKVLGTIFLADFQKTQLDYCLNEQGVKISKFYH